MKERPISFRADMVRAILDDSKTQTRRVIEPQPYGAADVAILWKGHPIGIEDCPYGKPGDRLWVKEALERGEMMGGVFDDYHYALYCADKTRARRDPPFCAPWQWKLGKLPSIFCPRWASRITLEITGVRVERVQEISEKDVLAEGCGLRPWYLNASGYPEGPRTAGFAELWDSINAKRGYPWEDNPWVWVVEFEVLESSDA